MSGAVDVGLAAARPADPSASIDWGMVGGVAAVAGALLAVVGIVAAVAIARWQDRQSKRREQQRASADASAPRTVFNQPEQRVGPQINVLGDVASITLAPAPNVRAPVAGASLAAPLGLLPATVRGCDALLGRLRDRLQEGGLVVLAGVGEQSCRMQRDLGAVWAPCARSRMAIVKVFTAPPVTRAPAGVKWDDAEEIQPVRDVRRLDTARTAHRKDRLPEAARPQAELEGATAEQIERGRLFGERGRRTQREVGNVREDPDPLGDGKQVADQGEGVEEAPLVGMVLDSHQVDARGVGRDH